MKNINISNLVLNYSTHDVIDLQYVIGEPLEIDSVRGINLQSSDITEDDRREDRREDRPFVGFVGKSKQEKINILNGPNNERLNAIERRRNPWSQ